MPPTPQPQVLLRVTFAGQPAEFKEGGRWSCPNPTAERLLNRLTQRTAPGGESPDPVKYLAAWLKAKLGVKVTYLRDRPEGEPDRLY